MTASSHPFAHDRTRLLIIAGPCVIESAEQCLEIGACLKRVCAKYDLQYVFKASFDKANRSSGASFRGPGMERGLQILQQVKEALNVAVLTDIHEPAQAAAAAAVVDILQIPAFLARQTDLLFAAGAAGVSVNVKKGQFMSPQEMSNALAKVKEGRAQSPIAAAGGESPVFLTERGTFFGYNRLVNDFTGLQVMRETGCPVIFDITHSTQQPAGQGSQSGGNPKYSPLLARAAVASGFVDGLFLECHPHPASAKSDAATVLPMEDVDALLETCAKLFQVVVRE